MKPAPFKYCAPLTLEEVWAVLENHGDEARLMAGGQSLVPLMNLRLAQPSVVVDLGRVDGLAGVETARGVVRIGAMATQRDVRCSTAVREGLPLIVEASRHVGHVAIQSRGTFGGSIAHADPAAELPTVALALDANVFASGRRGTRAIPASEFFVSAFTTALGPTEVLTGVELPTLRADEGWSFREISRRHGDFALLGVAAVAQITDERTIARARLALSGVADTPVRADSAEAFLEGQPANIQTFREAAHLASNDVKPVADIHASGRYRRNVAGTLVARALIDIARHAGVDIERTAGRR